MARSSAWRRSVRRRCPVCQEAPEDCGCAELPRVRLPVDLCVIRHVRERTKPSNTARILERLVENCTVFDYAEKDAPLEESAWRRVGHRSLVLFPSENAAPFDTEEWRRAQAEPTQIVLLDASWRQARRMSRRAPGVRELQRYRLPDGAPSRWRVRRATRPDQLSTLETVLRLLELGGESPELAVLETAFARLEVPSHRQGSIPPSPSQTRPGPCNPG